ncbi:MAG: hypothetical protein AAGJ35_12920, partial [Myxococcota bacterium]
QQQQQQRNAASINAVTDARGYRITPPDAAPAASPPPPPNISKTQDQTAPADRVKLGRTFADMGIKWPSVMSWANIPREAIEIGCAVWQQVTDKATQYLACPEQGPSATQVRRRTTEIEYPSSSGRFCTIQSSRVNGLKKCYSAELPQQYSKQRTRTTFTFAMPAKNKKKAQPPPMLKEEMGELAPIAAQVLMKILFVARVARYDLLRPVNVLAKLIIKWTIGCDKALRRLVCYMKSTVKQTLKGYVGENPKDLRVEVYTDADFASCLETAIGVYVCVRGPNTWFPLAATSKKQGCVSHSTPEAEIVAADHAVRHYALPAQVLSDALLGKGPIVLMEDNEATLRILRTGKSPTLRYLSRGACCHEFRLL